MRKRDNESHILKDLIPQMLKENRLKKGMDQLYVKEAWANVMGKGVVTYTDSVSLKNQTLIVKLSSSALREELEYGKDKIINMLNDDLDGVIIKAVKLL